jgi:diguanylate cyclase (GGDEF)-like protein
MSDKLTILIVDDNPDDILIFKRHINKHQNFKSSVEIFEKSNGADAINCILSTEIDCILLDYNLPDKTGLEILKILQADCLKVPPVIILTGQRKLEVAVESLKLGAEDYLIKDEITQNSFCRTIQNVIEKNQLKEAIQVKEKEIKNLAYNDYLTGLPNRLSFDVLIKDLIHTSEKNNIKFMIMFVDLDRFKDLNDSLGHEVGDLLIKAIALRISSALNQDEVLSRFGGDEFVILKCNLQNIGEGEKLASSILRLFSCPFELNDNTKIQITPSLGLAVYPLAGNTSSELMRCADIAMFKSKDKGGNQFSFYTEKLNNKVQEKIKIEIELRKVIAEKDVYVFFQPIIDLDSNELFAVEALVRFNNNYLSSTDVEKIISIAEDTNLMRELGDLIFIEAFKCYSSILSESDTPFKLTINISVKQLEIGVLKDKLHRFCAQYKINFELIILELTETAFISNIEKAKIVLLELIDLGVSIYMDDFGTGYSSLNLLREFPISGLKIDKCFIQDMATNTADAKLVNSVLLLASNMSLTVIAEGIENEVAMNMLRFHDNIKGQGYYFSSPCDTRTIKNFIKNLPKTKR